jgi:hypothetical protein
MILSMGRNHVHVCNPSYSGGGGRRIYSFRPAQAVRRPCLKKSVQNKGLVVEGEGCCGSSGRIPGFHPQHCKINAQIKNFLKSVLEGLGTWLSDRELA